MTMMKRGDEGERCYRSMKQWDGWLRTLKVSVPGEAAISRTTFLKCVEDSEILLTFWPF